MRNNGRSSARSGAAPRIALYSHDTCGLGHLRRNLVMAEVLAGHRLDARVLAIAGAAEAKLFPTPDGVDCLTLPALAKEPDGAYRTRSLGVGLDELLRIRAKTIQAALRAFRPDLLIVDKVPRGALGELDGLLAALKNGGRTRLVLGLRDVLDDPDRVRVEWSADDCDSVIDRYYDEVWVYGDRDVYDVAELYGFGASVRDKIRYTGYFDRRHLCRTTDSEAIPDASVLDGPNASTVLCMVGGGQDGAALAESFATADLPHDARGVMLTGPFMPERTRARLRQICQQRPELELREFVAEPDGLIRAADRVIAMGGYNSICEVLAHGKPLFVVPRVSPRREQLVRAQCFHDLGLAEMCHPDLASPDVLSEWMAKDLPTNVPRAVERVDFGGLDRLPALAAQLLARRHVTPPSFNSLNHQPPAAGRRRRPSTP